MAGIFGYFSFGKQPPAGGKLADMVQALKASGCGVGDVIQDDTCFVGKTVFPSASRERPSQNAADVNITVYGEIYDGDLEKSISNLYREGKLGQLKTLNGSFAAAIYDKGAGKLTLVNDRHGLVKLLYYRDEGMFCFAPKIAPLLALGTDRAIRNQAIADFFLFGYFLGDKTFFEHVLQLPAASILEISKDGMKLTKYWDYQYAREYDARPEKELADELGALWQASVERRVKKHSSLIIPISGGLDSRGVLCAALKCMPKDNITTCTFAEKGSYDFEIGTLVAQKAGVKNIPLGVEKENFEPQYELYFRDTEGMCDATPIFPPNRYAAMAQTGNTIMSGFFGDALMGDHLSPQTVSSVIGSTNTLAENCTLLYGTSVFSAALEADTKQMLKEEYLQGRSIRQSLMEVLSPIYNNGGKVSLADIQQTFEFRHLRYKYEMQNVLRFRNLFDYICPVCDNSIVDFMLRVPPALRFNEGLYKSMLTKQYAEMFNLPVKSKVQGAMYLGRGTKPPFLTRAFGFAQVKTNEVSTGLIHRNIFGSRGKNYIDFDNLLRTNSEYRNYIKRKVDKVSERKYFNRNNIETMWKLHMQGKKNYSVPFGYLVTFELLLEKLGVPK